LASKGGSTLIGVRTGVDLQEGEGHREQYTGRDRIKAAKKSSSRKVQRALAIQFQNSDLKPLGFKRASTQGMRRVKSSAEFAKEFANESGEIPTTRRYEK